MSDESNGNTRMSSGRAGGSNEDLSEYTDADESISAPTEFFAEFLSALMLKDYTSALKYCKLILQYEPNNITAREFYPLILDKIKQTVSENSSSESSDSEGGSGDTSGEEAYDEDKSSHSDSLENDGDSVEENTTASDKDDELVLSLEISSSDNLKPEDLNVDNDGSAGVKGSDGTTNSYSSLEDEEAVRDDNALEEVVIEESHREGDSNGNTLISHIGPLSEEDYNFNWFTKIKPKADKNNVGKSPSATYQISSDSESPTDPVTQQTIEMLRAKFVQASN